MSCSRCIFLSRGIAQMLEEALATDKLIAMAMLAPGWENDYDGRPSLRSTACLCRVATHQSHRTRELTTCCLSVCGGFKSSASWSRESYFARRKSK